MAATNQPPSGTVWQYVQNEIDKINLKKIGNNKNKKLKKIRYISSGNCQQLITIYDPYHFIVWHKSAEYMCVSDLNSGFQTPQLRANSLIIPEHTC